MHIERGMHGGRTVVTHHNGATIVSHGRGGYVQRAYMTRGGRTFVSRTFVSGGVVHVGVYRSYFFGGVGYYGWYPGFWYHPGFYAWGWNPWPGPVYWGVGAWGWGGPWWGFYGGWWNPYPSYAAPYFWLTDYLIAQSLQAAYAARAEANAEAAADASSAPPPADSGAAPAASGAVTLTPEVKEAIAQEVKAQLAAQQAQAQSGGGGAAPAAAPQTASASGGDLPPALNPAQRTFVVDTPVTAVADGQECGLTSGDVLTRLGDTPDENQTVSVSVAASQKSDCAPGQTVAVKVDDLQEMYNHFSESLSNGMGELAKKQGTGGMPAAPDTGTTASDVPTPQADPNAAADLSAQQQQANQVESQVKQETAAGGGS